MHNAHTYLPFSATRGCLSRGCLVFAPNSEKFVAESISEEAYIVTADEITKQGSVAQLVVLSSAWSNFENRPISAGYQLPNAFIQAGEPFVHDLTLSHNIHLSVALPSMLSYKICLFILYCTQCVQYAYDFIWPLGCIYWAVSPGAQCVLTALWPLPSKALDKFYFHFYQQLQTENYVSAALKEAVQQLRSDDR